MEMLRKIVQAEKEKGVFPTASPMLTPVVSVPIPVNMQPVYQSAPSPVYQSMPFAQQQPLTYTTYANQPYVPSMQQFTTPTYSTPQMQPIQMQPMAMPLQQQHNLLMPPSGHGMMRQQQYYQPQ